MPYSRARTFSLSDWQTVIVEVYVVWQRLVLRREVGSSVFQEPPFHSIFIFLFLPPDKKTWKSEHAFQTARATAPFFTGFMSDYVHGWIQQGWVGVNEGWKEWCFSNHLQRLCSSSSFFLIFSCFASSISSFVLLGFLLLSPSPSFFTTWPKKNSKNHELRHSDLYTYTAY